MGEVACDEDGSLAAIQMVQVRHAADTYTLIARRYSAKYVALLGKTFSENAMPQNESGVYAGWNRQITTNWQLSSYIDIMYFPWMKYQASNSTWGVDGFVQMQYQNERNAALVRYRYKAKQYNIPEDDSAPSTSLGALREVAYEPSHQFRIQHQYEATARLSLKTTANLCYATQNDHTHAWGFSIGEQASWKISTGKRASNRYSRDKIQATLGVSYFKANDYDARIYTYEPSLLYAFSQRSFYGHGIRSILLLRTPLVKRLNLIAKIGSTLYFDRDVIGSGLEEIPQSHREDIQIQIQWKL
jgi:hypothetical protein